MHGIVSRRARAAIKRGGNSAVGRNASGRSAVDDENWFSDAAWGLYGKNPGEPLHLITSLGDVRLCQRYASGEVKPPAYFLRRLLRSKHGEQWLGAVMDGCDSAWWADMQRARRIAGAIDAVRQ